jgi:5-formyltetrahydrofolate cyclo-ligase
MAVFTQKADLREEVLKRRAALRFDEATRLGRLVQERLIALPEFIEARKIALYSGKANEAHTDIVLASALELQKEVSFPRVDASIEHGGLVFLRVTDADELTPGPYGIKEPSGGGVKVDPSEFDLIVVPGIAFDAKGARIGYGKGYYDKALDGVECEIVALAFDLQVLQREIPTEAHDKNVSMIVTETRVIKV